VTAVADLLSAHDPAIADRATIALVAELLPDAVTPVPSR
jgi:hypothetical protein